MPEDNAPTAPETITQEGMRPVTPWSAEENAKLREIAAKRCTRALLNDMFPGRTHSSIWKKIAVLRNGVTHPKVQQDKIYAPGLDPEDPGLNTSETTRWRDAAAKANNLFLAAIQRAAA